MRSCTPSNPPAATWTSSAAKSARIRFACWSLARPTNWMIAKIDFFPSGCAGGADAVGLFLADRARHDVIPPAAPVRSDGGEAAFDPDSDRRVGLCRRRPVLVTGRDLHAGNRRPGALELPLPAVD